MPLFASPLHITLIYLASLAGAVIVTSFVVSFLAPSVAQDGHPGTDWLDGLRGVAAMLVALNHAPFALIAQGASPHVFYFPLDQHAMFHRFGAAGVQIFFCITGALFARKLLDAAEINWTSFFEKRVRRIAPAYFVAATIAFLVAVWAVYPNPLDPVWILRNVPNLYSMGLMRLPHIAWFDLYDLIGVNWTLGIEWVFYVMLPIVFMLHRKFPRLTLATIILIAVLDSYLTTTSVWAFFVVGALISGLRDRRFPPPARTAAYLMGAAALFVTVRHWPVTPDYGFERLIGMGLTVAAIFVAKPWFLRTRALVALGNVSYSFYLLHVTCIYVVCRIYRVYVGDIGDLTMREYAALTGTALAVAVVAATLSYICVERPFMRSEKRAASSDGSVPAGSRASQA